MLQRLTQAPRPCLQMAVPCEFYSVSLGEEEREPLSITVKLFPAGLDTAAVQHAVERGRPRRSQHGQGTAGVLPGQAVGQTAVIYYSFRITVSKIKHQFPLFSELSKNGHAISEDGLHYLQSLTKHGKACFELRDCIMGPT